MTITITDDDDNDVDAELWEVFGSWAADVDSAGQWMSGESHIWTRLPWVWSTESLLLANQRISAQAVSATSALPTYCHQSVAFLTHFLTVIWSDCLTEFACSLKSNIFTENTIFARYFYQGSEKPGSGFFKKSPTRVGFLGFNGFFFGRAVPNDVKYTWKGKKITERHDWWQFWIWKKWSLIFYMYICCLLNICTNNFRVIAKYKLSSH